MDIDPSKTPDIINLGTGIGAASVAIIAFVYKFYRMIKSDNKGDALDADEKSFRDMLRDELEAAKNKLDALYAENNELQTRLAKCETKLEMQQKNG